MKKAWFRRKEFGWGFWPIAWQGWLVLMGYLVGIGFLMYRFVTEPATENSFSLFIGTLFLLSVLLIAVASMTAETVRADDDPQAE